MQLNFTRPLGDSSQEMTTSAQDTLATQNQPVEEQPKKDPKAKKRNDEFRARVDLTKVHRRKLIANWTYNIDYRRGKPFTSQSDEDQIAVPLDWILTKTKQAALFSQIPQVRVNHTPESLQPWVKPFETKLNDKIRQSGIETAMDECLPDVINAAGIGIILVSYEAINGEKEVPSIDFSTLPPDLQQEAQTQGTIDGQPVPTQTVPTVVDKRYSIQRISPADFLWPINFTGSNFDNAPWLGRSGRVTWSTAVKMFNLKEEDKEKVLGEDRPMMDKLTHDVEKDKAREDAMVGFDEIFYREHEYDETAQSYDTIHHLVFVNGIDDPVIDEPWKGQQVDEKSNSVIGANKYPIRTLTLAYLTDEPIPPSDTAIGRPLVNEINRTRTQWIRQRERNIPVRWFDVNRLDPAIGQSLMRGTWQNMVPVQGDGSRIIGEVARANTPNENFEFNSLAQNDLHQSWGAGPNQVGSGQAVETAEEAKDLQSNFQTVQGRERAKVGSFFVSIAEVVGGMMCLFEDPSEFGEGFDPGISKVLSYSILADSTLLVDANQRLQRLNDFMNTYLKTGWVNPEPVLKEIATLVGLDPNVTIKAPDPKPPVEPNISLRLTGAEDMMNPLMLAFMLKSGQAPSADLIDQAMKLIQKAVVAQPQQPPAGPDGQPPVGPDGQPLPPDPNNPAGGPPGGGPVPPPPPPKIGDAQPNASALPTIDKRSEGDQS